MTSLRNGRFKGKRRGSFSFCFSMQKKKKRRGGASAQRPQISPSQPTSPRTKLAQTGNSMDRKRNSIDTHTHITNRGIRVPFLDSVECRCVTPLRSRTHHIVHVHEDCANTLLLPYSLRHVFFFLFFFMISLFALLPPLPLPKALAIPAGFPATKWTNRVTLSKHSNDLPHWQLRHRHRPSFSPISLPASGPCETRRRFHFPLLLLYSGADSRKEG